MSARRVELEGAAGDAENLARRFGGGAFRWALGSVDPTHRDECRTVWLARGGRL